MGSGMKQIGNVYLLVTLLTENKMGRRHMMFLKFIEFASRDRRNHWFCCVWVPALACEDFMPISCSFSAVFLRFSVIFREISEISCVFGDISEIFGDPRGHRAQKWVLWGPLEAPWETLGVPLGSLGSPLGALWAFLGLPCSHFESLGGPLEQTRRNHGCV